MGIVESFQQAFELYKERVGDGALYSLILAIVNAIMAIPIIGPIIYAVVFPKAMRSLAEKFGLAEGSFNESEARKAVFLAMSLPAIILTVLILAVLGTAVFSLRSGDVGNLLASLGTALLGLLIGLIIWLVLFLRYSYAVYALILGKEREIVVDYGKGARVLLATIIVAIALGIVYTILTHIPTVGNLLVLLFNVFFAQAYIALYLLTYVRSL